VARVVAFVPDLLFGSNVVGALSAAGHEVRLVSELSADAGDADVLVVDLTAEAGERIELVRSLPPHHARTLAFYSHVEADVRERAERAGFDLVVPRSRMAREGGALVDRLLASDG
jgi:DNA-binding NarL/FixJ family response regulator